ncbi:MAG: hypothetical protein ACK5U8_14375, partial [Deltaproteobacteria bacterium]
MPKTDPSARLLILEAELARLQRELAVLDRQWSQKLRLGAFGLLAIPALYWGPEYAVIILLCTPALIATQAYLIGVRRNECRELIGEARRELATLRKRLEAKPSEPTAKPSEPTAKPSEPTAKPSEPTAKPSE